MTCARIKQRLRGMTEDAVCKFVYLGVLVSACMYLKLCQWTAPALLCRGASSAKSASPIIPLRRCLIRISKTCAEYNVIRYTNTQTDAQPHARARAHRQTDRHSLAREQATIFLPRAFALALALASRKTHTRAR